MKVEYMQMSRGIGQEVNKVFGEDGIHWSCLGWDGERKLKYLARRAYLDTRKDAPAIVEIGTHRGVSSAILATMGWRVVTFDIEVQPLRDKVWTHFGCADKIDARLCNNDNHLATLLAPLKFDAAFIDGCHDYSSVSANFDAVARCGRVIFHDYELRCHKERTVRFVDELRHGRTTKIIPFAYWESEAVAKIPWEGIPVAP